MRLSVARLLNNPFTIPASVMLASFVLSVVGECPTELRCFPPFPVLLDTEASRSFLATVWQVNAATLALTVAGILFVFEAMARQRQGVRLSQYGRRTNLDKYIQLGAASLVALGVPLAITSETPPIMGATFGLITAAASVFYLPHVVAMVFTVSSPDWLRGIILEDVIKEVSRQVRRIAISESCRTHLDGYDKVVPEGFPWHGWRTVQTAPFNGKVWDIDLDALDRLSERQDVREIRIHFNIGESVVAGESLVDVRAGNTPLDSQSVVILTHQLDDESSLGVHVSSLYEEGIEAIKIGSPAAIRNVASTYHRAWMAWATAWRDFGQELTGGRISAGTYWRLSHSATMTGHVAELIRLAAANGHNDVVSEVASVPQVVLTSAVAVRADDLVAEMCRLVEEVAYARQSTLESWQTAISLTCAAPINVCKYRVVLPLDNHPGDEQCEYLMRAASTLFVETAKILRALHTRGWVSQFDETDRQFREILRIWETRNYSSEHDLVANASEDDDSADVQEARKVVAHARRLEALMRLQVSLRFAVFAWMLESELSDDPSCSSWEGVRKYGVSLGDLSALVDAVGDNVSASSILLTWARFENAVGRQADSTVMALRAFALLLLTEFVDAQIPPLHWMNPHLLAVVKHQVTQVARMPKVFSTLLERGLRASDVATRMQAELERSSQGVE